MEEQPPGYSCGSEGTWLLPEVQCLSWVAAAKTFLNLFLFPLVPGCRSNLMKSAGKGTGYCSPYGRCQEHLSGAPSRAEHTENGWRSGKVTEPGDKGEMAVSGRRSIMC